ncbi:hypothetical protein UREG_01317 [Uncinocarpus reesii 1704]|uniref:Uncharacterized protein n=1 Tax=Uncinocarpus reesii (strain UAMH 1704) TaxID=336963 RepID=C4JHF4_UNCRE|nr:uncharacterized protein UREG_01317 [Uncinocarpus reesii 1704]EEP76468.1 hypothetical protein UREG_01317 [Uncinocarpus reesii 1704]
MGHPLGRRRISIIVWVRDNAMLSDDASSYLKSLGFAGIHRTSPVPPTPDDLQRLLAHFDSLCKKESENVLPAAEYANGASPTEHEGKEADHVRVTETDAITGHSTSQPLLFLLSAFDEIGVSRNAGVLSAHLKSLPPMKKPGSTQYMIDLAHTLCKRSRFPWRAFCTASSLDELLHNLEFKLSKPVRSNKRPALGFVFTGQGAQWYAMGRELLAYPRFRKSIEAADDYIKSLGSTWSLCDELQQDQHNSKVHEPAIAHIACTALQVAIVDLLASWTIFPSRVVGHSSGEIAAAYSAGKIGRKSAWKIAYFRGVVSSLQHHTKGSMLAVGISEPDIAPYLARVHEDLQGELIIACYNSPTNLTISGDEAKINALKVLLDADSVFSRKLAVSNAYHSSHMKAVVNEYSMLLEDLISTDKLEPPQDTHMFSSVTGALIELNDLELAEYWATNLISPVRFVNSLCAMCFENISKGQKSVHMDGTAENVFVNDIVEIGPHGALRSAIKQILQTQNTPSIGYLQLLDRSNPGLGTILSAVGSLTSKGYTFDVSDAINAPNPGQQQMLVNLPPYSFDHSTRVWYESRVTRNLCLRKHPRHDLFGTPVADWNAEEPRWRYFIRLSENPWLREHAVTGSYIYPGVGYVVMAIEAAKQIWDPTITISGYRLRDVSITTALNVPDTKQGVEVMISMSRMDESSREKSKIWWNFRIASFNPTGDEWIEHCTGYITIEAPAKLNPIDNGQEAEKESVAWQKMLKTAFNTCVSPLDMTEMYDKLSNIGLTLGQLFQNLSEVKLAQGSGEATGTITIPDVASSMPKKFLYPHVIHPCTIDSMLHLFLASVIDSSGQNTLSTLMLPTFMKEVWISSDITSNARTALTVLHQREKVQNLQFASMLMITGALRELEGISVDMYKGYLQNYYHWLLEQVTALHSDSMPHLPLDKWIKYKDDLQFRENLLRKLTEMGPDGEFCVRCGSNIVQVLKKEVDPLYLFFGMDDLIEKIYAGMVESGDLRHLIKAYVDVIGHNRTDLNILEIGAGTGSSTATFLETLSPLPDPGRKPAGSKIEKYTFTDISAGFFERAKERFQNWRSILDFHTLDIGRHPKEQGFSGSQYDIIVAGNVLHATPNIRETLRNVRYLLKPGGKLIMCEGIRLDFVFTGLAFGQLEGWWLGVEDGRKWSPWLNEKEWNGVLQETGFAGVEIAFNDRSEPDLHFMSVLVSSAIDNEDIRRPQSCGNTDYYIRRVSVRFPSVLSNPTEEEFDNIRHLLATCKGSLWVTGDITASPEFNMIAGLIRSLRWERDLESPNLVTLSISNPQPARKVLLQAILDVFKHQFVTQREDKDNAEYLLKDGVILTNRLVDAPEMNDYLTAKVSKLAAQMIPLGEAEVGRPLRLTTAAPGMLNALQFETDPNWYEPLGEFDVEVKIKAVGLNFRDVMIAMGEQNSVTFGSEGAGVVTRVGAAVTKVKIGDRVVFVDGAGKTGTFQTYGRVAEDLATMIPKDLEFEVAAALPSVFMTAIYSLYTLAGLTKGETVLIHSAAGGVGQAAIMLANLVGAEVFATVSTPEKAELLMREYGVKQDHIFSSRDWVFAKSIMRITNGSGVDVVLNSLSGEFLRRTWDCIAPFGRFIEIGKKDAQSDGRITMRPFLQNVMIASVDLLTMMRHRPKQVVSLIKETIRLYTEGKIKAPSPIKVFDYSQLEKSFRSLQSGKGMGKFVIVATEDAVVPVVPPPLAPVRLREHASYVLSGGLGGVGRSVALWMASKGAKSLIFLSRSGSASPAAQEVIRELHSRGATAHIFSCDVSDKAGLEAVLNQCKAELPPIKGCIQGAMVLADKMFENMTHDEFQMARKPKVQGSWNLHVCLPKDMDFFIMLSSAAGLVGNRGQANYTAGNTYQDALAAHRVALGLPAVSLDLGALLSIGYIAENRQRLGKVQYIASLMGTTREEEIHGMIEYYITPKGSSTRPAQVASTLTTAAQYAARGMPVPSWMHSPLFTQLSSTSSAATDTMGNDKTDSGINVTSKLASVTSISEASDIIADAIRSKLSKLLSIPVENIDTAKSVSSNGIDSLVAMEFRTWLAKILGADVPLLDILGTMPVAGAGSLSTKVAMASKLVPETLKTEEVKAS